MGSFRPNVCGGLNMSRILKGLQDIFKTSQNNPFPTAEQEQLTHKTAKFKQQSTEEMDVYALSSQFSSMSISSTTTNGLMTDSDSSNDLQQAPSILLASAHPSNMATASDSGSMTGMIVGLNIKKNQDVEPHLKSIKSFKPQFSPSQRIPGAIPRDFQLHDSEDETEDNNLLSEQDDDPCYFPGDFDDLPKKTDSQIFESEVTKIEQKKQSDETPTKKISKPRKAIQDAQLISSAPELSLMDDVNDEKWMPSLYRRKTDAGKSQNYASYTIKKDGREITYGFSVSKN